MKYTCCLLFSVLAHAVSASTLSSQLAGIPDNHPMLPASSYDENLPTPASVLGYNVAEWHVRHDQLLDYMQTLADASPRVSIETIGRTHENRRQTLLTISSEANLARIDEIHQQHMQQQTAEAVDPDSPLVVWLGYSIHGNEASGSNASMLVAWMLAAMQGGKAEAMLENTVILIDPSLNPDGLGRFAHWVNMHRGAGTLVSDRANREHNEVWPGGRFNHFWFDLNRDWLPLVHPESRARVNVLHHWRPHVVADFHEMGTNSTYFFQPGVPSRQNPWTPQPNFELTAAIGRHHARALDAVNQPYFTEEQFDDFYYGKGSTYPDALGTVGILFEQASARGHLTESDNGRFSFGKAVRNQFLTSLSTLTGALENHQQLLTYRRDFRDETANLAAKDRDGAYLFGRRSDPVKVRKLVDLLQGHQITVHELTEATTRDGIRYEPGSAFIVPLEQRAYRLLKSMFETRKTFEDNTFYDVSAWNLPMAFDLDFTALGNGSELMGQPVSDEPAKTAVAPSSAVAYAFDWSHYYAPRALNRLQQAGFSTRVAEKPFAATINGQEQDFSRGSIVINAIDDSKRDELATVLSAIAANDHVPVHALDSVLTPRGPDLGGPSMEILEPVKPLMIVGQGVSALDAGEVWHLFDQHLSIPLTMVDTHRLGSTNLDDYSHVLMVNGNYSRLTEGWVGKLKAWVNDGGILVTTAGASRWLESNKEFFGDNKADADKGNGGESDSEPDRRPYADFSSDFSNTVIGGAIVDAEVDRTHPLGYGLAHDSMALFKRGTNLLRVTENQYDTPLIYGDKPLLSGFLGDERRVEMAGQPAVIASRMGRGSLIRFADNPNFRGFWYGTHRLYFNALFMGGILNSTRLPEIN